MGGLTTEQLQALAGSGPEGRGLAFQRARGDLLGGVGGTVRDRAPRSWPAGRRCGKPSRGRPGRWRPPACSRSARAATTSPTPWSCRAAGATAWTPSARWPRPR